MNERYPEWVIGDEVETWSYYNHGRAAGDSTFGTVVSVDPVRILTSSGSIQRLEEETRLRKAAPRPVFTYEDLKEEFAMALKDLEEKRQVFDKARSEYDRAKRVVDTLRTKIKANGGICPHPSMMVKNDRCLVCGVDFGDGYCW